MMQRLLLDNKFDVDTCFFVCPYMCMSVCCVVALNGLTDSNEVFAFKSKFPNGAVVLSNVSLILVQLFSKMI